VELFARVLVVCNREGLIGVNRNPNLPTYGNRKLPTRG
jgi:hypothetical protein